jgi:hypothetical protein
MPRPGKATAGCVLGPPDEEAKIGRSRYCEVGATRPSLAQELTDFYSVLRNSCSVGTPGRIMTP